MNKLVLMFPGVGSQYPGMGKDFYDNFPVVRETFQEASQILSMDLAHFCFNADKAELAKLQNAQLALLTICTAMHRVYVEEIGLEPDYCVGHSLGEYTALCCAGVIPFRDALLLVQERGRILSEVANAAVGTMMWVLNVENLLVEQVCEEVSKAGAEVYVSAYDSPYQSSISGHNEAIMIAAKRLEKAGALVIPLKLSGPFHSQLMQQAAERFKKVLTGVRYLPGKWPVIANHHVQPYTNEVSVIENLFLQLVKPLRWRDTINYLNEVGVTHALEIGPNNVLKFLLQKNTDQIKAFSLSNYRELCLLKDEWLQGKKDLVPVVAKCLALAMSSRNRNFDESEYEEGVEKPYAKVVAIYEELQSIGRQPTDDEMAQAIEMLRTVLITKKVSENELNQKLSQIRAMLEA